MTESIVGLAIGGLLGLILAGWLIWYDTKRNRAYEASLQAHYSAKRAHLEGKKAHLEAKRDYLIKKKGGMV